MIKVKHIFDAVEPDDGQRLWVEPIGLTRDLQEWCKVDLMLPHFGPPMELWRWLESNPKGYDFFRAKYHEYLSTSPHLPALQDLMRVGRRKNFTLMHHEDDPAHNTAVALHEFLLELEAYCKPE